MSRQGLEYSGAPVRYRVSLAPTRRRYWFALDLPAHAAAPRVLLTYDYLLLGPDPINEPVSYEAVSYLRARAVDPLGAAARREDTALPPYANPRTQELAQTLYQRAGTDVAFVAAALDYLRRGGFVYSLEPQPLGRDAVDELLFRTREGFCGHYASAFVTLMRAAHVPARVVTGYLGGEWNPVGEFLEVRQADAHAWAEVWLEGRGWTRVDPTAVVAPERLRRGVLDLMPNAFSASDRLLYRSAWLRGLLQRWAAANAWWGDHVVKFDYASQLDVLAAPRESAPQTPLIWAGGSRRRCCCGSRCSPGTSGAPSRRSSAGCTRTRVSASVPKTCAGRGAACVAPGTAGVPGRDQRATARTSRARVETLIDRLCAPALRTARHRARRAGDRRVRARGRTAEAAARGSARELNRT